MIDVETIKDNLGFKKGDIVIYQKKDLLPVSLYGEKKELSVQDFDVWIFNKETFVKRKFWFGFKRVRIPHSIRLYIKLRHIASGEIVKIHCQYNLELPNLLKKLQNSIERTILKK